MKLTAINRQVFTAKFYDWTRVLDSEGGYVYTHFYKRDIKLYVQVEGLGRLTAFFEDDDIRPNARFQDVRDRDGNEIVDNIIYSVRSVYPNLTTFGKREGYVANLTGDYVDG